jgi:hypothetical protein
MPYLQLDTLFFIRRKPNSAWLSDRESLIDDSMLQLIGGPYGLCSAFANDHAGSHRIARRHARHD